MKIGKLRQRLRSDRTMTTINLRIPEDVVEDLKQIAQRLGISGYQALIRVYVGQGLRADLERTSQSEEVANLSTRHARDERTKKAAKKRKIA